MGECIIEYSIRSEINWVIQKTHQILSFLTYLPAGIIFYNLCMFLLKHFTKYGRSSLTNPNTAHILRNVDHISEQVELTSEDSKYAIGSLKCKSSRFLVYSYEVAFVYMRRSYPPTFTHL